MDNEVLAFKNVTAEDFVGVWGGVPMTVKAGQAIYMEGWKARHFAKHLIDRELTNKKIPTDNMGERAKLEVLCLLATLEEEKAPDVNHIIDAQVKGKKKKAKEEEFKDLDD